MSGLDTLLARSISSIIRESLDQNTVEKIEKRLCEKYGINITQSVEDFYKLDNVLREFFGDGVAKMEKQLLENVLDVEKSRYENSNWIIIKDSHIAKLILESFGDDDKKKILNTVLDEPRIISEILNICKIPQTSGYRKIKSLIQNGLLVAKGFITTSDGKMINKYKSLFENVRIVIEKNKVGIEIMITRESFEHSSIMQVIRCISPFLIT